MSLQKLVRVAFLVAVSLLAGCATRHTEAPKILQANGVLKQTYYQGELRTEDNVLIRFTVYQPALKPGETAPLIVQTHPFGLWRLSSPHTAIGYVLTSGGVVNEAWKHGYWVVSFDQRGHGDSGDVMHIADPKKEGRDVSRVIDWAQKNLAITQKNGDPVIGMIGESYGAGIQYIASALDPRIDALVPIGGWYELERVLAPNDVPKSGWLTILVLAGNTIADYDRRLNKAYWHARSGSIDQWVRDDFDDHDAAWFCARGNAPHADALILQGFRDVLFPVNEGLDARTCLQNAGRDVRFIGVNDGHLLPMSQHSPGKIPGWNIEKKLHCDGRELKTQDIVMNWFDAKLRGRTEKLAAVPRFCLTGDPQVDNAGAPPARQHFTLPHVHVGSGFSGFFEWAGRPLDRVENIFVTEKSAAKHWQDANNGTLRPALSPAVRVDTAQWVAGVPHVSLDIDETDREKPVLFLQVAAWRPGAGTFRILSQQVTPVQGKGHIETDLSAVRGYVEKGEVVGLLVRGYQSQYRFSGSGWGTDAGVSGSIDLPMTAASCRKCTHSQQVVTTAAEPGGHSR